MDLNAVKQKRVEDVRKVLAGELGLSDEVKEIIKSFGKDPSKFLPTQILTLLRYTPDQVRLIFKLMTDKNYVAPQPGSQEVFLNTNADLVLYGGAAGAGKTAALLMDSLRFIEDPNYNAVYFRRNTT